MTGKHSFHSSSRSCTAIAETNRATPNLSHYRPTNNDIHYPSPGPRVYERPASKKVVLGTISPFHILTRKNNKSITVFVSII